MQKTKRSNITVFVILTTITILTWVIFDAYQRFNKTEIKDIPPEVLLPLSPSLDKQTLDNIEAKLYFSQEEVAQFTPAPSAATPLPEESTPSAEASPSAEQE